MTCLNRKNPIPKWWKFFTGWVLNRYPTRKMANRNKIPVSFIIGTV